MVIGGESWQRRRDIIRKGKKEGSWFGSGWGRGMAVTRVLLEGSREYSRRRKGGSQSSRRLHNRTKIVFSRPRKEAATNGRARLFYSTNEGT